jgi:hypothetical protein
VNVRLVRISRQIDSLWLNDECLSLREMGRIFSFFRNARAEVSNGVFHGKMTGGGGGRREICENANNRVMRVVVAQ